MTIQGFESLAARLTALADVKQVKKLGKAAVVAGQRVLVKHVKSAIPGRYKDARKTVGQSVKRPRVAETPTSVTAKVGFAVGKKMPGRSEEEKQAARGRRKAAGRHGVGITARNIHWLVLGTKHTRMKPLAGVLQRGVASGSAEAANKIKQNLADGLHRLAKK